MVLRSDDSTCNYEGIRMYRRILERGHVSNNHTICNCLSIMAVPCNPENHQEDILKLTLNYIQLWQRKVQYGSVKKPTSIY